MIDYLYYRVYKYYDKKSLNNMPSFFAVLFSGGLIGLNILVFLIFLAKINLLPFLFSNKSAGILSLICALISFVYYKKSRREIVFQKYSTETNAQRIKGTIIIFIYILLSIGSIFIVAFFKPGYLPKLN
jgi:hypothetical protein